MYPKPDRSDQTPNFVKSAENDAIDIGWNEGNLSDGRGKGGYEGEQRFFSYFAPRVSHARV